MRTTRAVLGVVALGLSACGAATPKYGTLPSWLPQSPLPLHRVVEASARQPQLGVEGDTIAVVTAAGRVSVTAVGPDDTIQGRYPVPETTPCTFVLTFDQFTGTVPINAADFTMLDEEGHLYRPQLSTDGTTPLTVRLHDVLPTGSGELRWAPGGGTPIVSWSYSVEID